MMGSKTLLSMRQFIEDAEKECAAHDAELEVKDLQDTKMKSTKQAHDAELEVKDLQDTKMKSAKQKRVSKTRRHQGIEDAF